MREAGQKLIALFFFCYLINLVYSQYVPYEKYTSKNGLVNDRITAISQDEKGFMWFGSYVGICRYDGIKFEKIDLPPKQQNKYVTFLAPAQNKMYAGFFFGGGLAEYSDGKIKSYFIGGKDSASMNDFICMTADNDGSILLCNNSRQIYKFENGTFKHVYSLQTQVTNYPTCIQKDKFNNIYLGTKEGLFIIPYPYKSERIYFPGQNIFSVTKDINNDILICRAVDRNITIQKTSGLENGEIAYQAAANLPDLHVIPFSGNTSKGFWCISATNGLVNVGRDKKITSHPVPLDYTTDINAVFADRENNIWIANDPGVFKISNLTSQSYSFAEIAPGGGALFRKNDSLIFASNSKHIYTINNNRIEKKTWNRTLNDYYSVLHFDDKENLWIGLWKQGIALARWNNKNLDVKKVFYEDDGKIIRAHALAADNSGNLWIAGPGGFFRIKNNKILDKYNPVSAAGSNAFITCITLDEQSKTLWLGDNVAGIIKVKYIILPDNSIQYKVAGYITAKNGLSDTYIRSILYDHKKTLWVGTRSGGIYRINETSKGLNVVDCNSAANLSCTRVTDIKKQDTTAIWFATCDGIYKYQYATNTWRHYNTSDGLLNSEVYTIAVDEKNIWALTSQGVTKLQIHSREKTVPPIINITAINVLGKPDSAALSSTQIVSYPYTKNSIGFSFAGASFIDEKRIQYKYMLQGYDEVWSEPVMTNDINYASLAPGKYVFKVLAANAKGKWSTTPATFEFEIVLPVYREPWFIFMVITAALLVIYFVRLQRLKQRYKIEKLRLTIAGDLHDDVGATLGSINLLSKTATRRLDKKLSPEEITPIFQKISQSAENTLEAMDDIVWSINPDKDKAQDLLIRMREFAIPLLEAKNIEFTFDIEGDIDRPIPMNLRRNAFLIYKECIHNIIKHSEATTVRVKVQLYQIFSLNIIDNGKGFDPQAPSGRNGLKNMHRRAEMVGGTLQIISLNGGTNILLTAPIR